MENLIKDEALKSQTRSQVSPLFSRSQREWKETDKVFDMKLILFSIKLTLVGTMEFELMTKKNTHILSLSTISREC